MITKAQKLKAFEAGPSLRFGMTGFLGVGSNLQVRRSKRDSSSARQKRPSLCRDDNLNRTIRKNWFGAQRSTGVEPQGSKRGPSSLRSSG